MNSVTLTDIEIQRFLNLTRTLRHESPHKYEHTRIKEGNILFILYNTRKLVYNENPETLSFLEKILEKQEYNKPIFDYDINRKQNNYHVSMLDNYSFTIGSDETGKGEWYGPLVITATCTSYDENLKLKKIGVTDSKKLSRNQILNTYKKIEKLNLKHETIILKPFSYNQLYNKFQKEGKNLNHLLSYLHSKTITNLLGTLSTDNVLVIIDKFDYNKMNNYLNINNNVKVIQESNAEKYIPVATSSIIAKYYYEKTLKDIEERYNINLRKTKPENINKKIIDKIAKTHFKNVKRYAK